MFFFGCGEGEGASIFRPTRVWACRDIATGRMWRVEGLFENLKVGREGEADEEIGWLVL